MVVIPCADQCADPFISRSVVMLTFPVFSGLSCITEHESFNAVCLNRDVLWTALVSLHDRESAGLPDREHVPNR